MRFSTIFIGTGILVIISVVLIIGCVAAYDDVNDDLEKQIFNNLKSKGLNNGYVAIDEQFILIRFESVINENLNDLMFSIAKDAHNKTGLEYVRVEAYFMEEPVLALNAIGVDLENDNFDALVFEDIRFPEFKIESDLGIFDVLVYEVNLDKTKAHIKLEYLADEDSFWNDYLAMSLLVVEDAPWTDEVVFEYLGENGRKTTITSKNDNILRLYNEEISADEFSDLLVIQQLGVVPTPTPTPTPTGAPTPSPTPTPIASTLTWKGMDKDKVSRGNGPNPDGVPDGHFSLTLTPKDAKTVNKITLLSTDKSGNPVGGQVWNTVPDGYWILGVEQPSGNRLNPTDKSISKTITTTTTFELYGANSGWFKEGQHFKAVVEFTDGTSSEAITTVSTTPTPTPSPTPQLKISDLQPGPEDGKDVHVYSYTYRNWDNANRGAYPVLEVGYEGIHLGVDCIDRIYIEFDLSSLPSDREIAKAMLSLYNYNQEGEGAEYAVYRVTEPWAEGEGTYHSGEVEPTAPEPWITWNRQPSFDSTQAYATEFIAQGSAPRWINLDVTELVENWYEGSWPNYGIVLRLVEENGSVKVPYFHSSESEEAELRPKLVVTFSGGEQPVPTPTPTPEACDWTGTWDTVWDSTSSQMHLQQTGNRVTGTYEWDNGKIEGLVSGNTLTGTWSEYPSYSPPGDAGDIVFIISEDCSSFDGKWRYGTSGGWSGSWTGARKSTGSGTSYSEATLTHSGFDFSEGTTGDSLINDGEIIFWQPGGETHPSYPRDSGYLWWRNANHASLTKDMGAVDIATVRAVPAEWDKSPLIPPLLVGHTIVAKCYDGYVKFQVISVDPADESARVKYLYSPDTTFYEGTPTP